MSTSTKQQGAEFKQRREAVGLSQYEVSTRSGIPRNRLSLFECGYAPLRTEEQCAAEQALQNAVREKRERLEALLTTA